MQFLITTIVVVFLFVGVVSTCPSVCRCTNTSGVVRVVCSHKRLSNIPRDLPNDTNILWLNDNNIQVIEDNAFSNLPNLTSLHLDGNKITSIKSDTFSNLTTLGKIDLRLNDISVIEDNAFNNLPNLRIILLSNNNISVIGDNAFNILPNLTAIAMENNPISFVSENAFENLPRLEFIFGMYCGGCENIPFWRWLKGDHQLIKAVVCYDYDRELLIKLQPNNFTDCFKCSLGYYDYNCNASCDGCLSNACDKVYGICADTSGCKPGWQPGHEKCNLACLGGTYGQNCNESCADQCYACHPMSGICLSTCSKGWMGPYCKQECSLGYYDYNCNESCDGCLSNACDKVYGICADTSGCKPGWQPGHEKCNLACLGGTYGQNCNESCADQCYACHPMSGICLSTCSKGWMGPYCKQECITGRYGINCNSHCHTCVNKICDRLDGNCTNGCIDGFRGVGCHTPVTSQSDDQITNYIYSGVGTFVVAVLICAIIVLATLRYRRKKGDGHTQQQNGHELGMRQLDNDAFNDHYANIGVASRETHYVDTIPVTQEQPYDTI